MDSSFYESEYGIEILKLAHRHCSQNKTELLNSELAGCFHCQRTFSPMEIDKWIDVGNEKDEMALCPYCGIDSVIGSKSNYPVHDPKFLKAMHDYWFKISQS